MFLFDLFELDDANGQLLTEIRDDAVPNTIINALHNCTHNGITLEDAVTYTRNSLVPAGYRPFPFRVNTEESFLDKLRSVIGTYRFRHAVKTYKEKGVDFSTYVYVPEFDEEIGEYFHEREDHCHILKRIWKHTREEGPAGFDLKGFDDAMLDPKTGLTQAALTGERKQSVQDAERVLSFLVAKFLEEHGHNTEGNYVSFVAGWHEAADGRGLTELRRCERNYKMLNMILEEWIQWYNEDCDFSTLDINMYTLS